ncbi:MAG: bifunctional DNA-formamidopyrimidine glycosylase/DNA-(apurinic or apyrimidinic site) lyase [Acidobacteriaceae bacterium]|nr:bifunctional DNA-formamidopyrimidine glycosylase/DNA-(apurinic or apyrimidinic site) lyase [Acidobacteriaceae bacterium]MBV9500634.1 bifunctional DNA-formamidopyrimidine glycosylase/DNA-(apurinic or apyrimidinic site) lyase [Acidobacteriaceae bacterium]
MPELPEVETVVRSVSRHVVGSRILHVELSSERVTRGGFQKTAESLTGARIRGVRRRGKQIFFDLDHGILYVHLGMTGKLLWNGARSKFTRALLHLEEGTLMYDDIRQFGRVEYFDSVPEFLDRAGPDALSIGFEEFYSRLKRRSGSIKTLLLNQTFISGVGNIYADEALFAARIHPRASARRISPKRARDLYDRTLEVLHAAIAHKGSSISDYVDTAGNRGNFQQLHCVYGREGQPCVRCGTLIRRIVLGQRGTHYCPRCQRP